MIFGCDMSKVRRCMRFEHEIQQRVVMRVRGNRGWHYDEYDGTQDGNKSTEGANVDEEHQLRSAFCIRNPTEMVVVEVPRGRQTRQTQECQ
jgi:hypothetical protein